MPTLAEVFNKQAVTHGIAEDSQALKLFLSDPALQINVPDELAKPLVEGSSTLLTMDAAKENPELKKWYYGRTMGSVDSKLEYLAKSVWGLSPEQIADLKKNPDTFERMQSLAEMVKDTYEKKQPPTDNEKQKKLEIKIAELNDAIAQRDEQIKVLPDKFKKEYSQKLQERSLNSLFLNYDYTDALPKNVQLKTARAVTEDALKAKKLKVEYLEENDDLSLMTEEGTVYYENNKPVVLKGFIDSVLAENKLLKVGKTAPTPAPLQKPSFSVTPNGNGSSRWDEAMAAAKEPFKNGTP